MVLNTCTNGHNFQKLFKKFLVEWECHSSNISVWTANRTSALALVFSGEFVGQGFLSYIFEFIIVKICFVYLVRIANGEARYFLQRKCGGSDMRQVDLPHVFRVVWCSVIPCINGHEKPLGRIRQLGELVKTSATSTRSELWPTFLYCTRHYLTSHKSETGCPYL